MIAYTATVVAFWVGVVLCTLGACRLIDTTTTYAGRCRDRRRAYHRRTTASAGQVRR